MKVFIEERSCSLGNSLAMTVYVVRYTPNPTNDHYTRPFGVYERKEVAEFVKENLENGTL